MVSCTRAMMALFIRCRVATPDLTQMITPMTNRMVATVVAPNPIPNVLTSSMMPVLVCAAVSMDNLRLFNNGFNSLLIQLDFK